MRMRYLFPSLVGLAVATLAPGTVAAQPNSTEPTVEVRLRSINDLLDKAEYIGGVVDKEDPIKQLRELIRSLSTDGKGIEGIDPKRPFGSYAVLTADVATSPVVLMVPIADEKRLLTALNDRFAIEPEKLAGGVLKLNVPLINEVFIRFANDYVYAARDPKHLDPKGLIAPKAFFANDDGSILSVIVRLEQIPPDLRTFVIGQVEHQMQEQMKRDGANKPPAERKLAAILADGFVGSVKSLADEGKNLSLRLFVDAKGGELSAEIVAVGKSGSSLAKNFAGLSGKLSLPAAIVASVGPVIGSGTKVQLTDDLKKQLGPAIDGLIEDVVKQAKPDEREFARKVLTTLAPTLKAGELDAASTLIGPDAKGRHSLLAAVSVKDGKQIESVLKEFAPFIPGDQAEFTFDVEKVGAFGLHKVEVKAADPTMEKMFGTKMLWLAISEGCIAMSIEPEGTALKAGLKAAPMRTAVFSADVSLAKALPAFDKNLKPDEVKALLKDAFGSTSPNGNDTISVRVEGGKQLTARISMKGKALRLATMLNELKGK